MSDNELEVSYVPIMRNECVATPCLVCNDTSLDGVTVKDRSRLCQDCCEKAIKILARMVIKENT
jgi:hypothetical protein